MSSAEARLEHVGRSGESDVPHPTVKSPDIAKTAYAAHAGIHHISHGCCGGPARVGRLELLHGHSMDARWHGPRLCRDDGAEVPGRIIKLPIADNQFVHKGDVLYEIDPEPFRITLQGAQAQMQRDNAALDYARENEERQATLQGEGWVSKNIYQQATSTVRQLEAAVAVDKATIAKAEYDLSRVTVYAPVNGYVTNLLARVGDYANVGQRIISLVDADSFWVDGYFEEEPISRRSATAIPRLSS